MPWNKAARWWRCARWVLANRIGVHVEPVSIQKLTESAYGAIVLEAAGTLEGLTEIGQTIKEFALVWHGQKADLAQAFEAWRKPLLRIFPERAENKGGVAPHGLYTKRSEIHPKARVTHPKVVIPVFPGTNCELDTARAFEKAGAAVETVLIRNLSARDISESIAELAQSIRGAQIIALPGGFSGGDEPDGSGKFIATVFRNPYVKDAVTELLENRDGLMLGICNGFQALIKLGLVPYGRICDMREDSPTLTFNTIGRHVSAIVRTRVTSVKSAWLALCAPGEIHSVAVSHGEGRFVASEEEIRALFVNGQVATQYVNMDGNPTMDGAFNVNGSLSAVEGILSADGRIFGKMAHSERYKPGLMINVPGERDQKIFAAGVRYFL